MGKLTIPRRGYSGAEVKNYRLNYLNREEGLTRVVVQARTKAEAWNIVESGDDFIKRVKNGR